MGSSRIFPDSIFLLILNGFLAVLLNIKPYFLKRTHMSILHLFCLGKILLDLIIKAGTKYYSSYYSSLWTGRRWVWGMFSVILLWVPECPQEDEISTPKRTSHGNTVRNCREYSTSSGSYFIRLPSLFIGIGSICAEPWYGIANQVISNLDQWKLKTINHNTVPVGASDVAPELAKR